MPKAEIEKLREAMRANGADMFIIPTADPHGSEYPSEHFKARRFVSGFNGSAGTMVVAADWAGLWTDGRYFLQAERQLAGTGCELFRMGQPGVPEMFSHIRETLGGGVLGADFRTLSAGAGMELRGMGIALADYPNLIDGIWQNRPAIPDPPAYSLGLELAGESAAQKLKAVRAAMERANANALVLTALDDIAWLFNIRGGDVKYLPVVLAYAVVERERAYLFIDTEKGADIKPDMDAAGVTLMPYGDVYSFVERYGHEDSVLAAKNKLNYRLYLTLEKNTNIVENDPIVGLKAVKNAAELENDRRVHLDDGVVVTRFLHWVKNAVKEGAVSELEAAKRLDDMRLAQADCTDLSFTTICGYGAHAAIIHYSPAADTDIPLEPRGLLLVDSGGQYRGGTTDVTRTIALGEVTHGQKRDFTLVLEGMLALMYARFPEGCTGYHLDAIAREPLWENELDYDHGTGHGVGYMLSVHEGPNGFRWKQTARSDRAALEAGMITSDEPGLYIPGQYGIRIENLLECVREGENAFGSFLGFKSLTFVPIDLDVVDLETLTPAGRERLNRYHAEVYEKLAPLMTDEERAWLREETRPV